MHSERRPIRDVGMDGASKMESRVGHLNRSDEQAKGKMAIQFDNGEKWLVELRGSGWSKDCTERKSWRMKKFGGLTSLDVKKE